MLPPDGAIVSSRAELQPFLSRPEYVNFLPEVGLLVVDSRGDTLFQITVDRVCWGGLRDLQASCDPDKMSCRPLDSSQKASMVDHFRRMWQVADPGPGRGLIFVAFRGMIRRLRFPERPGPPIADLLAQLANLVGNH